MKALLLFLTCSCLAVSSFAQVATGKWRMHLSPTVPIDIAAANGTVFTAFPAGLVEYDVESGEVSNWTNVSGLSDNNVSAFFHENGTNSFWVGYKNGNIDRINNGNKTNIPAIKLANVNGSKQINQFRFFDNKLFVCTDLGIVVINPKKNEVISTYYPNLVGEEILDLALLNDSLYALTKKNIYKAKASSPALADTSYWKKIPAFTITANEESFNRLVVFENQMIVLKEHSDYGSDTLFTIQGTSLHPLTVPNVQNLQLMNLKVDNQQLLVIANDVIMSLDQQLNFKEAYFNFNAPSTLFLASATHLGDYYYACDLNYGVYKFKTNYDISSIPISGPPANSFFTVKGGNKGKIVVAGGTLVKNGGVYNSAGGYILEDEKWTLINRYNQPILQGKEVWDVSSGSVNPDNTNEIAFGSKSEYGLHLIKDGKTVSETYSAANSILEMTNGGPTVTISDVEYDDKGNLWIMNSFSDYPLKMLSKEGTWYRFDLGTQMKSRFTNKVLVDYKGNKWMVVPEFGIVAFTDKGTYSDPSDDQFRYINDGASTGALPSKNVTALAVDFDNKIWIGTTEGFAILYNSANVFDAAPGQYNAQRIKIPYEGLTEYMLGKTYITDIEIDGGNRKWIATSGAGIFCLSPDGLEIIHEYNTENSQLISNDIMDLGFNHKTGEMFIITDRGMMSLRVDASYEDPEYSEVIVFPNPVLPSFDGVVTIQGIKYDSDVKVTDMAGNLVYQTTSNGGTATWNGRNLSGEKAKTGVYLIWTKSNQQKGRKVGKVTVIN